MTRPDYAREIRAHLTRPRDLCAKLGLTKHARNQAGDGITIRCPVHQERTPSCSVTRGPDGTIRVRCFGCDFTADALGLIAVVRGIDARSEFRELLIEACHVGGLHHIEAEILAGEARPDRPAPPPLPEPLPPPEFAPADEVRALWDTAIPVTDDTDASGYLVRRRIDPDAVEAAKLLRVLPCGAALPRWARFSGLFWTATGHRMLARLWGAQGQLVSLRAWRITDGDSPKRLPPAGHRCSGHVLANRIAVGMLLGRVRPRRIIVAEGEPDHVVDSLRYPSDAVIGLGSGWWTPELAARVPSGCRVVIRTDPDDAGERYAEQVARTLGDRVEVWRAA